MPSTRLSCTWCSSVGDVVGDLGLGVGAVLGVDEGLVGEQVGDAVKSASSAEGQLERRDAGAEAVAQLVERALEVGPLAVELVDEHHAGHAELLGPTPQPSRSGPRRRRRRSPRTRRGRPPAGPPRPRRRSRRSPGVSIRLTLWPSHSNGSTASEMEIWRFCSSGSMSAHGGAVLDPPDAGDRPGLREQGLGQGRLAAAAVADEGHVADLVGRDAFHRAHCTPGLRAWPARSSTPTRPRSSAGAGLRTGMLLTGWPSHRYRRLRSRYRSERCSTDGSGRPSRRRSSPSGTACARPGSRPTTSPLVGLLLAVVAAVTIGLGYLRLGLLFVVLAALPDLLDGALAKASNSAEPAGCVLRLGRRPRHRHALVRWRGLVLHRRTAAASRRCCRWRSSAARR